MARSRVINPFSYYFDPLQSRAISNGQIFVGEPDLDPKIPANRKTVFLIQEDGTEVPIAPDAQPLLTGGGGSILFEGSPVRVQTEGSYSILIEDSFGDQKFFSDNNFFNAEDQNTAFNPALRYNVDTGATVDSAYVIQPAFTPFPTQYIDRQVVLFTPNITNTNGNVTLNIVGESGQLGPVSYLQTDGTTPAGINFFNPTRDYMAWYDEANNVFVNIDVGIQAGNQGFPVWNNYTDYLNVPTYILGSDNQIYISNTATGPNTVAGVVDPTAVTATEWDLLGGGGRLGNFPPGYWKGLGTTFIAVGEIQGKTGVCRGDLNIGETIVTTNLNKLVNVAFAEGNNQGCAVAAQLPLTTDQFYYVHRLIKKNGDNDIGLDINEDGSAILAAAQAIDADYVDVFLDTPIYIDGSGNIEEYTQDTLNPDYINWVTTIVDVNAVLSNENQQTPQMTVPPNRDGDFDFLARDDSFSGTWAVEIIRTDNTNLTAEPNNGITLEVPQVALGDNTKANNHRIMKVSATSEIAYRGNHDVAFVPPNQVLLIYTRGFYAHRGNPGV